MQIMIDIPDEDVPNKQEIIDISLHFINGKVCECTYPYIVLPKDHGDLKELSSVTPPEGPSCDDFLSREERLKMLMETGEFDFLKDIPSNKIWKLVFMLEFIGDTESEE